jgi:cytoskeletal protein RodZ
VSQLWILAVEQSSLLMRIRRRTLNVMTTKFLALISVIGLATISVVQAQLAAPAELPAESPSPAKKHRQHKTAEATASPAETAASPATAESPAASPKAKRARKKANTEAAASPATSPTASASPGKFKLGNLFKPKSSVSASPAAAPATGGAGTATPAPGGGHGLVWVNTETHVYHKEGSRFYGATKKGKYVSEADAIKEGDRAAAKGQ